MHSINFTLQVRFQSDYGLWVVTLYCHTEGSSYFHRHNWREKTEDTVILHTTSSMKDGCSNPQVGKEGKAWSTLTVEETGNCKKVGHFQGHHRDESGKTVLIWTQCVTGGIETETTALWHQYTLSLPTPTQCEYTSPWNPSTALKNLNHTNVFGMRIMDKTH